MDFWNTIIGNRLANTLVKELPKLTKLMEEEKIQYTATMNDNLVQKYIEVEVSAGNRYIGHYSHAGKTTVIMEKK